MINVVVAALLTVALRLAKVPSGRDDNRPGDYRANAGDPRVHDIPELTQE